MSELLNEIRAICRRSNMCFSTRFDSMGEPTEYQLFRQTSPRLTYLGKRTDEKSFLALARSCANAGEKQPERAQ